MDHTRQRDSRAASIAIWAATLLLNYELAYAHTITRLITNDPRWQIESSFPVRNTVVAVVPLVFVYALGRRFERIRSAILCGPLPTREPSISSRSSR